MQWIKFSKYNPPPQGLKIVCFRKGDLWIARRYEYKKESYYIEIAYNGTIALITDTPDYWMQLELPEGYSGFMKAKIDGDERLMTLDEIQLSNPDAHQELVELFIGPLKIQ